MGGVQVSKEKTVKKGYFIESDGCHYSFESDDTINQGYVKIFHSRKGVWAPHLAGKLAAKLTDDGNGVTVRFRSGEPIRLDYCQESELYWLLRENLLYTSRRQGCTRPKNRLVVRREKK